MQPISTKQLEKHFKPLTKYEQFKDIKTKEVAEDFFDALVRQYELAIGLQPTSPK